MAFSLIETLQKSAGFPELQKIDPNTLEVKRPEEVSSADYLGQAALPAVLIGIYKFTRTDEGNAAILKGELSGILLSNIFGESKSAVIDSVSEYTGNSSEYTETKMESVASEAVHIIRQHLEQTPDNAAVKDLMTAQRHDILSYLPGALQIGKLLNDNSLDDRTNQMEGPVSGLMHKIGQVFSSSGNDKKEDQKF